MEVTTPSSEANRLQDARCPTISLEMKQNGPCNVKTHLPKYVSDHHPTIKLDAVVEAP